MIHQEFARLHQRFGAQAVTVAQTTSSRMLSTLEDRTTALVGATAAFELVGLLTLILLFLFAGSEWFIEGPITLLAAAAILHRPWLRSHNYWFVIAAILVAGNSYNWLEIDNHKYLITYWTIALCCVLAHSRPQAALAYNARLLIGLVFLFATLWKVISPDYLNGDFYTFELLMDSRFQNAAQAMAGVESHLFLRNQQAQQALLFPTSQQTQISLAGVEQVRLLAQFLTWWTIGIEATLALLFFLPTTRWTFWLRSSALLIFVATTYTNAPVIGFGWLIAVMGVAQCKPESWLIRLLFLMTFFLVWLYGMPWSDLSYGLFSMRLPLAH